MRTLRFRRGSGHLFITDDGFIVHFRHHDYDRSHGGAFGTHKSWKWTEIDRIEFARVPLYAPKGPDWFYRLYAWPTDECRRTLSDDNPLRPPGKYDSRHSLRVRKLSQLWRFGGSNHRSLATDREEGDQSPWIVCTSDSFRRRQWRGVARAIRKRTQGRLTLDTSVLRQRHR